ncbi:MAG: PP2C family protein-serine/threonine phosphatase [Gemmatimonadetes bacterium]|nr:PP2C family protein-serine/threonine phosphatase [Gemmatimonadota bacterium]
MDWLLDFSTGPLRDRGPRYLWFKLAILAGAGLAILLLVQTSATYRYVSENLVRLEARRSADRTVRTLETAARLVGAADPAGLGPILDDIRLDAPERVAWISVRSPSGELLAASGPAGPLSLSRDELLQIVEQRGTLSARDHDGRPILVALLPCRCARPLPPGDGTTGTERRAEPARPSPANSSGLNAGLPRGPLLAEVAMYRDGISAPFGGIRRQVIVTSLAALALLGALAIIWLRFRPYLRGRLLEHQLVLARNVQHDLLPPADRQPPTVGVGAACVPASHVGGDFYDVVPLDSRRVAFLVGDVSGHGISAALLMGLIHGAMSASEWTEPDGDRPRAAQRLNELLLAKSSAERFASLFWCAYDADTGLLRYINAGHLPALWMRRTITNEVIVERLSEGGPVLGVLPGATYQQGEIRVEPGDLLAIFSDGVIEADGDAQEEFGEGRLVSAIRNAWGRPAREICDGVLARVRAFEGNRPSRDDQTLLVVDFGAVRDAVPQPAPDHEVGWMTASPQAQST